VGQGGWVLCCPAKEDGEIGDGKKRNYVEKISGVF
jgi:hypothetical protein